MTPSTSDQGVGYVLSRYFAAALLLMYGFAKLTGAQFTVLDSELDKPLRDVSGFWLTWYYFGYSEVYGTIIALVQIVGAIALLVRRTALLAACMLLPVIGNIILIDIFYRIDRGALIVAILIALCLLFVLAVHAGRLRQLLLPRPEGRSTLRRVAAASVAVVMIAGAFGFSWLTANFNNRRPTPIDGTWVVSEGPASGPTHVYFERNRAWVCVFRYADHHSTHHFEIDRTRTIRIWTTWLSKGPLLFEGTYDAAGRRIVLTRNAPRSGSADAAGADRAPAAVALGRTHPLHQRT